MSADSNGVNGAGAVKSALATKDGLYLGTLNAAVPSGGPQQQVNMSDPNVKKLVYNLYRGLLGTYNDKANDVIAAMPDAVVHEDQGISRQIESMLRQSASLQNRDETDHHPVLDRRGSSGRVVSPITFSDMSGPPPPPPMPSGSVLSTKSNPDGGRGNAASQGPPSAIAGAMMRDKRPFTYTPGGLDLSEIRSPRMAKRISKNALSDGVPQHQAPPSPLVAAELSPQAIAAMQPQIAVSVFPQGPISRQDSRQARPSRDESFPPPPPALNGAEPVRIINDKGIDDYQKLPQINPDIVRQLNNHLLAQQGATSARAPSPHRPQNSARPVSPSRIPPPPPPAVSRQEAPPPPPLAQFDAERSLASPAPAREWSQTHQQSPVIKPSVIQVLEREASPPPLMQIQRERSPPKPTPAREYSRTQSQLQSPVPKPVMVQTMERERSPAAPPPPVRQSSAQVVLNLSQLSPQPEPTQNVQNSRYERYSSHSDTSEPSPSISPVPNGNTRRPAQMGSLYIPPLEKQVQQSAPTSAAVSVPSAPISASHSPPSAQLKNNPMPWMNSSSKSQSPPPAWVERESTGQPKVRIIPIQMEGSPPPSRVKSPPSQQSQGFGNTRVIPIQVEGRDSFRPTQNNSFQTDSVQSPSVCQPVQQLIMNVQKQQTRPAPSVTLEPQQAYNNVVAHLDNMNVGGDTSPVCAKQIGAPTQSRSFRILQLITDTTDQEEQNDSIDPTPREAETHTTAPTARRTSERRSSNSSSGSSYQGLVSNVPQERRLVLEDGDKELMDLFKQKVNEEQSLHGRSDPRYKGSHIPSKTFRMLQNFTVDTPEGARGDYSGQQSGQF